MSNLASETNRAEFKEKLTDELEKFAVAFLNAKGGKIYIGIDSKGNVVGVNKADEIQLKIKDRLKDNIRPSIMGLFDIWTEKREKKLVDSKALREAIINAFAHNDYSSGDIPIFEIFEDRFEITTYGNLLAWIGKEEFFTGLSKPRNPEIMRIFKDLELVENLGSGVPAITKLYGREIFKFSESVTRISLKYQEIESRVETAKSRVETVKSRVENPKSRVENPKSRVEILRLIKENPNIKFAELSEMLNISIKGVEKNIKLLKEQNLIKRIGPNKGGHWVVC